MTDAAPEPTAPEPPLETGSALVLAVNENPGIVLLDSRRADAFLEAVKEEIARYPLDLSTAKGRKERKALAFKVTTSKTAIDAAGKKLKEEAQKTVKTVDAARRDIWDKLEALADEVRAPVTEWETRETLRIEKADGIIQGLGADAVVTTTETAEDIAARLERVEGSVLDPAVLGDRLEQAEELRATAIAALEAALERVQQEERDRAELERLRKEAEARAAEDAAREAAKAAKLAAYEAEKAARREAAEAEEARKAYVEQIMDHITEAGLGRIGGKTYPYVILIRELEEKVVLEPRLEPDWPRIDKHRTETLERVRQAFEQEQARAAAEAEKAEAQRIAEAERAAAETARREQEARHQEALAAEQRRADEAEAARKRQEQEAADARAEQERAAEAQRQADAARAADQEHRASIMKAAKIAIMGHGVGEATAVSIVRAIAAGEVPSVSIKF